MRNPSLRTLLTRLAIGLGVMVCVGCATTGNQVIGRAMRKGDWDQAIRLLSAESILHPENARTWARLGEAQYNAGLTDDARMSFVNALDRDPSLVTSHLFLGFVAERKGETSRALWHYQVFADRKPGTAEAREALRRVEGLRQAEARRFAQEAIAQEERLSPGAYSDSTIGVVYFRSVQMPEHMRPLAKGLAEMTVTDLSKVRALRVVERLKTERLLEELRLSNTSAFDSTTAPRFGKLLGAANILGGDMSELTESRMRLDPVLVSAKSGGVTLAGGQAGALREFFTMQKQMVYRVVEKLGITLSEAERDSIGRLPTESLDAFLAWSRGLDHQDRGRYDAARQEFDRAAGIDPGFREAQDKASEMRLLAGANLEPGPLEGYAARTSGDTEWQIYRGATDVRLAAMLANTGLVRIAPESPTGGDDPVTPPAAGESSVIIHGRFDD